MSIYKLAKSGNNDKSDKSKKSHTLRNKLLVGSAVAAAPGVLGATRALYNPVGAYGVLNYHDVKKGTDELFKKLKENGKPLTMKAAKQMLGVKGRLKLAAELATAPYYVGAQLAANTLDSSIEAARVLLPLLKRWK